MSKLKIYMTLALMAFVVIDLLLAIFLVYVTAKRPLKGLKTKDKRWLVSIIGKRTYYAMVGFVMAQPVVLPLYKYV